MNRPDAPPHQLDVVVVTYNSAPHLEACLAPLRDLANVFVIDNDSGDASVRTAQDAGATVVANSTNRGFAAAANQGAALGSAPFLMFVNPDAVVDRHGVQALLSALSDPQVGLAGIQLSNPDGSPQRTWWPFPSAREEWRSVVGLPPTDPHGFLVGAVIATRRDVFDRLGGLDESFWLYGEESDLYRRARSAGLTVAFVDTVTASHIGGASSAPGSAVTFSHFARGADLFVLKHDGPLALVSFRLAGLVKHASRALLRPAQRSVHLRFARRTAAALLRHPLSVPPMKDPQPDHRIPPAGDLVVASLEPWDDVWRRNQFLVRELQEREPERRVLWVEPPLDLLHQALRTGKLSRPRRELRTVPDHPQVLLFRPTKWLPRTLWPWVDRALSGQVIAAAHRAGITRPTLWVNDSAHHRLPHLTGWPTVYDITDDWLSGSFAPRELRRLTARESSLMERAEEVVVCSAELQRRRSVNRRVHLIPNAVDAEHLRRPQPRPADLPAGPTAVYVGSLHDDRIDVELVRDLAAALPDVTVCLVGPDSFSDATHQLLSPLANLRLMGPRPYDSVPAYLQHADVLIVPHAVNRFTESLDPIKAYELQAIGRPTVATPVAGFREMGAPVVIADRSAFAPAVRALISDPPPTVAGEAPSWATRAAQFSRVLEMARADRPMKVVYVGHCAKRSGGELALLRLLPSLRAEVDCHVIFGEDGPMVAAYREAGISAEVLPMADSAREVRKGSITLRSLPIGALFVTGRYVLRLKRRLRQLDADLVHTNTLKAAFYGGLAGRLAQTPVIWHVRDRVAPDYLPGFAVRMVHLAARALPSAIIANSESTRSTLGIAGRDATVTPSPVVFDPYSGGVTTGPGPDIFSVGIIGRIAPWKGQDVFLRAFATAFAFGTERARIIGAPLFGEDDFESALRSLAVELGIEHRVTFVGQVDDVGPQLQMLSVLVHASVSPEPFGQVVVEGLSAGLPVVATNAGGPSEILSDRVNGLLVPPGDVDALAAALVELRHDDDLRRRLGEGGRSRAQAFLPEHIAPQVLDLYRKVLAP